VLPDGTGLDGRNRLRACEKAGVEPHFESFDGLDPEGFVISENVTRRHLTAGQRGMAAARMMPEAEEGKKRPSGAAKATGCLGKTDLALRVGRGRRPRSLDLTLHALRHSLPSPG